MLKFDDIKVSTKTFIIDSNLVIQLDKLFKFLPFVDYMIETKKRGRKKKIEPEIVQNSHLKPGDIISLNYKGEIKGVDLKKKKRKDKKRGNYFRNSIGIVMIIDDKQINYKISKNGTIQMTGCRFTSHAEKCIEFFWNYIKNEKELYSFSKGQSLEMIFIPVMRNIDFDLNFIIDREKLDGYFNNNPELFSLFETSVGYTGVNIKFPLTKQIETLILTKLLFPEDNESSVPTKSSISYNDHYFSKNSKLLLKKIEQKRYNTFLVFHSGKVIMSGMEKTFMEDTYHQFMNIIDGCHDIIKEKLDV